MEVAHIVGILTNGLWKIYFFTNFNGCKIFCWIKRVAEGDAFNPHDFTQQVWPLRSLFGQLDNCRQLLLNRNFCIYAHLNEWFFFQFWDFHLEIFPSFTKFPLILSGIPDTFCYKEMHEQMKRVSFSWNIHCGVLNFPLIEH